jgi:acyl-CoA reductase-like NAD-dependent aldehyde dehydrogenase
MFIDGELCDTQSGKRFETVNPATGEVITSVPSGDADDVDRAVRSARRAFRAGVWSRLEPRARMEVLYRFATLIDDHGLELGLLDTLDVGKPIMDMVAGDVPAASLTFHYFTETSFTGSTDVGKLMMVLLGRTMQCEDSLGRVNADAFILGHGRLRSWLMTTQVRGAVHTNTRFNWRYRRYPALDKASSTCPRQSL